MNTHIKNLLVLVTAACLGTFAFACADEPPSGFNNGGDNNGQNNGGENNGGENNGGLNNGGENNGAENNGDPNNGNPNNGGDNNGVNNGDPNNGDPNNGGTNNNGDPNNGDPNNGTSNNGDNNGGQRADYCDSEGREICDDDIDNNCNGLVDEGCTCTVAQKSCYSGHPDDLTETNTSCRSGTQACTGEFYSECEGQVLPETEVCDGVDNDCNGQVDEVPDCANAPPVAICPPDQVGPTLSFYTFTGGYDDPDGDAMASASWRILDRPTGSTSSPNPPSDLTTEIFADVQGIYVLELQVTDTNGDVGRCTTTLTTNSEDQLRVEMVWNIGNNGDTSDLDLHLLKSPAGRWFSDGARGDDCYWRNCRVCDAAYSLGAGYETQCRQLIADYNADPNNSPPSQVEWTTPLDSNDPRLDLDDIQGNGPENVNIRTPLNGVYRLGVHYWHDDGFGDSTVTLRVYCAGNLVKEFEPVLMRAAAGPEGNANTEFWEVTDIVWNNGTCALQEFGAPGCREICTLSQAQNGGCPDNFSRGLPCQ